MVICRCEDGKLYKLYTLLYTRNISNAFKTFSFWSCFEIRPGVNVLGRAMWFNKHVFTSMAFCSILVAKKSFSNPIMVFAFWSFGKGPGDGNSSKRYVSEDGKKVDMNKELPSTLSHTNSKSEKWVKEINFKNRKLRGAILLVFWLLVVQSIRVSPSQEQACWNLRQGLNYGEIGKRVEYWLVTWRTQTLPRDPMPWTQSNLHRTRQAWLPCKNMTIGWRKWTGKLTWQTCHRRPHRKEHPHLKWQSRNENKRKVKIQFKSRAFSKYTSINDCSIRLKVSFNLIPLLNTSSLIYDVSTSQSSPLTCITLDRIALDKEWAMIQSKSEQ
jgi:hypothetical protein